jgi:chloride channel 7
MATKTYPIEGPEDRTEEDGSKDPYEKKMDAETSAGNTDDAVKGSSRVSAAWHHIDVENLKDNNHRTHTHTDLRAWIYPWKLCTMLPFCWTLCISFGVAVVYYFPSLLLAYVMEKKFDLLAEVSKHPKGSGEVLGVEIGLGAVCMFLAALIAAYGPPAVRGSGLPEMNSYLGCGIPKSIDMLEPKAWIFKSAAMVLVVMSGVVVGREGPAIVIGGGTAYCIGRTLWPYFTSLVHKFPFLLYGVNKMGCGDFTKAFSGEYMHEVVHIGSAAGFACAFNAPIGGMLFIYEELSVHWDVKRQHEMGSRILCGCGLAVLIVQALRSSTDGHVEQKSFAALVVLEDHSGAGLETEWTWGDVPIMLLMSMFIGVFIAHVGHAAFYLDKLRKAMPRSTPWLKIADAVGIAIITACLKVLTTVMVPECKKIPAEYNEERHFFSLHCHDDEYNEAASLTFVSTESAMIHLFSRDAIGFSASTLLAQTFIYVIGFVILVGCAVPAGTFVPNLVIGALIGRLFGLLAAEWLGEDSVSLPGVYAIIGATCALTSWTRTMLAICVTMFEITGDVSLVVPLLLAAVCARSTASVFSEDGWAHTLLHAPHSKIAHFTIEPQDWVALSKQTERSRAILFEYYGALQEDHHSQVTVSETEGAKSSALVLDLVLVSTF